MAIAWCNFLNWPLFSPSWDILSGIGCVCGFAFVCGNGGYVTYIGKMLNFHNVKLPEGAVLGGLPQ